MVVPGLVAGLVGVVVPGLVGVVVPGLVAGLVPWLLPGRVAGPEGLATGRVTRSLVITAGLLLYTLFLAMGRVGRATGLVFQLGGRLVVTFG